MPHLSFLGKCTQWSWNVRDFPGCRCPETLFRGYITFPVKLTEAWFMDNAHYSLELGLLNCLSPSPMQISGWTVFHGVQWKWNCLQNRVGDPHTVQGIRQDPTACIISSVYVFEYVCITQTLNIHTELLCCAYVITVEMFNPNKYIVHTLFTPCICFYNGNIVRPVDLIAVNSRD